MRDTWIAVQRVETLLFQVAALPNIAHYRTILEEMNLEGASLNLLLRLVNGFDPIHLSPQNYLNRYPFSSLEAIRSGLELLVESGYLTRSDKEKK